jgi:hypothetical protein
VLLSVPLLAHAYAGTASRYVGDDYCAGYIFRDYGLWGGQLWHYKSWSAVPTTLFLMAMTEPGGARLAAMLPAIVIVLWLAAATWALRELSAFSGQIWSWIVCLFLAELIIFVTFEGAPNVAQSVYLRVPMLAYTVPLVVLTVYGGWLARVLGSNRAGWPRLMMSLAVAFICGAFGPVCAALVFAALASSLLLLYVYAPEHAAGRWIVAAGVAGSVAALVVIIAAPGNAARQAYFPHPPGLMKVGIWSASYAVFLFCRPLVPFLAGPITRVAPYVLGGVPRWLPTALGMGTSIIPLVLIVTVAAALARTSRVVATPLLRSARWWAPPLAFVLVCACMAPGAYGTSAPPPPRALIIPEFVIACLAGWWGFALGSTPRASQNNGAGFLATATIWAACAVVAVASTPRILSNAATLREWAHRWDSADHQLRADHDRGIADATVPALQQVAGVGSFSTDPHDWVNICAAHYYDLRTITGVAGRE